MDNLIKLGWAVGFSIGIMHAIGMGLLYWMPEQLLAFVARIHCLAQVPSIRFKVTLTNLIYGFVVHVLFGFLVVMLIGNIYHCLNAI